MDELSIKVEIADRDYPMKVNKSEEARVRMAAKLINEKLKSYQKQFGHDDKQDLLAMTALDCVVEKLISTEAEHPIHQTVVDKITYLSRLVSQSGI